MTFSKICLLSLVFGRLIKAQAEPSATNVTIQVSVQTNSVHWDRAHTSVSFICRAIIDNQTRESLTVSNLFQDPSGLSLKVTDRSGAELVRLRTGPFHSELSTIDAGSKKPFWPYYGSEDRFGRFAPGTNTTVTLQLEGNLIGSRYTGSLTSNIVELNIPK